MVRSNRELEKTVEDIKTFDKQDLMGAQSHTWAKEQKKAGGKDEPVIAVSTATEDDLEEFKKQQTYLSNLKLDSRTCPPWTIVARRQ